MPSSRDTASSNDGDPPRSGGNSRNQPLVIVSEQGRHSEAARRIVRAQAARASAAQSRETRARNREDRHLREGPQSPGSSRIGNQPIQPQSSPNSRARSIQQTFQPNQSATSGDATARIQHQSQGLEQTPGGDNQYQQQPQGDAQEGNSDPLKPLINWITNVLHLSASTFAAGTAMLASSGRPQLGNASDVLSAAGGILSDSGAAMEAVQITGGILNRRLPIALPKGFAHLQKRIRISDAFLVLLSRTACFDFASPGVEGRLNELLFDIVMTSATATLASADSAGHPIEKHLRIACACLTIFQGQRADGRAFAEDQRYVVGLQAAWAEAIVLDQDALKEPKSAEAALWAVFIISVTCGVQAEIFRQVLLGLLQDLQLRYWDQVRTVLLDFIYPGSFLDEPCRQFYDQLRGGQPPPLAVY